MRKIFEIYILDWRRVFRAPLALLLIIALVILPSLYAWFNIAALWDPYSNTKGIKVAVTVEDKGSTVQVPGEKEKAINVGRELKNNLKKNKKLGWTFVSDKEAQKGVESGKYYAAIRVPKDFSKDMVSVVTDDVKKPTIDYTVNEKINAIAPKMTSSGASTIVSEVSNEFIGTVSKAVLKEFNTAGIDLKNELPTLRKLKTKIFAANDALPEIRQMGKEAINIEKKLPEIKSKAKQVEELDKRIPEINDAAGNILLVEKNLPKIDELGQDVLTLQKKIPEIKKIAADVKEVNNNFGDIKKTLNNAVSESDRALTIVNQAMDAIPKVEAIAKDGNKYVDKVDGFVTQIDSSFDQIAPAVKQNLVLMKQISDNVKTITSALKSGAIDPDQAVEQLNQLEAGVDQLQKTVESQIDTLTGLNESLPNHPFDPLIEALKTVDSSLTTQKQTIEQVKTAVENGKEPANELLDRLDSQATEVSNKLGQIIKDYDSKIVPALQKDLNEVKGTLKNSKDLLKNAQSKIPEVKSILAETQKTLTNGQKYLKTFQKRLPEIQKALNDATKAIDTKLDTMIADINEAADFYKNKYPAIKKKVHTAANFVRDDLPGYEKEIHQAAKLIKDKMPDFETTVTKLADLSRNELPEFEKAIKNATGKIDDFDKKYNLQDIIKFLRNDADKDSEFLANPIHLNENDKYPIANYGSASSPFYTALCLWVGGLLLISLLRADVEAPLGIYKHYHRYFGRLFTFLTIGLAQALVVTLGNIFILKVDIAEPFLLIVFSMLISVVFLSIVYTLVALFNNVGKGLAIIILVLQISGAGGNFPIQVSPPFFQAIYPFLPFTYAVNLLRESVGGVYAPNMWKDIIVLVGFGVLFILIGTLLKKPLEKVVPKLAEKVKRSKLIH